MVQLKRNNKVVNGCEEIHFDSSQVDEKTLVGSMEEPLESGDYTVNGRIIGEDGHLIEGNYSFNVQQENEDNESLDERIEQTEESNYQLCFLNKNSHTAVNSKKPIAIPTISPFNLIGSAKEYPRIEKKRKTPDKRTLKRKKTSKERRLLSESSKEAIIAKPSGI